MHEEIPQCPGITVKENFKMSNKHDQGYKGHYIIWKWYYLVQQRQKEDMIRNVLSFTH